MKIPNFVKKIFAFWPIFGLLFFLIWGFYYILPILPDDFISIDKIKNIFKKEEKWEHPDEKYNFLYSYEKLKPKTLDELQSVITPPVILSDSEGSREEQIIVVVSTTDGLQTAIKNATSGDTIQLKPGIYKTNLFINKDLTIQGQGTSTIIIGGDTGTAVYAENCKFNLYNLTIKDSNSAVKITNSSGEMMATVLKNNKKSGIELRNSKFTIKENIITENGSYGVFASADSEVVIEGNFIEGNEGFEVRIEREKDIYR